MQREASSASRQLAQKQRIARTMLDAERRHRTRYRSPVSAVDDQERQYEIFGNTITGSFNSQLRGLLRNGELAYRFQEFLADLLIEFIEWGETSVVQYSRAKRPRLRRPLGRGRRAGAEQAGATASLATQGAAMIRSILSSAAEAFAGVFGFLAPSLGPLAPARRRRAQARSPAWPASVASADIGMWNVPQDMLTLVHHNELVMPAAQAGAFRACASAAPPAATRERRAYPSDDEFPRLGRRFRLRRAMDEGQHATMMKAIDEAVRHGAHLGLRRLGALEARRRRHRGRSPAASPAARSFHPGAIDCLRLHLPALPGQGWSVHKKPTFATIVASHVSGREVRDALYQYPIWQFELTFDGLGSDSASFPGLGTQSLQSLMGLFLQCQGQLGTFLYSDPTDDAVAGQIFATGDSATTSFRRSRARSAAFSTGGMGDQRLAGHDRRRRAGSGWSLIAPNSLVFATAPASGAAIGASFPYAFLCRFDDDAPDFEEFMHEPVERCEPEIPQSVRTSMKAASTAAHRLSQRRARAPDAPIAFADCFTFTLSTGTSSPTPMSTNPSSTTASPSRPTARSCRASNTGLGRARRRQAADRDRGAPDRPHQRRAVPEGACATAPSTARQCSATACS